jgi:hypothetical protein
MLLSGAALSVINSTAGNGTFPGAWQFVCSPLLSPGEVIKGFSVWGSSSSITRIGIAVAFSPTPVDASILIAEFAALRQLVKATYTYDYVPALSSTLVSQATAAPAWNIIPLNLRLTAGGVIVVGVGFVTAASSGGVNVIFDLESIRDLP